MDTGNGYAKCDMGCVEEDMGPAPQMLRSDRRVEEYHLPDTTVADTFRLRAWTGIERIA